MPTVWSGNVIVRPLCVEDDVHAHCVVWQRDRSPVVHGQGVGTPHVGAGDERCLPSPFRSGYDIDEHCQVDFDSRAPPTPVFHAHLRCAKACCFG